MSDAKEHDGKKHGGGGHGHGGGGSHEEHEGAPEWLISFADNVTLMMGFFVILLAMNLKPASSGGGESKEPGHPAPVASTPELLDVVIAIREAFNNPVDPNSSNPIDLPLIRRIIERAGPSQADQEGQIGREHDVRSIRPSSYFSPAGSIPFDDGTAVLNEAGREALRQMHKVVRGHNLVIEARGHASAAEAFGKSDRGHKLSYDRALAVAEALIAEGLPWAQIRVVACGDGERLVPVAYDEAGHRTNQRVEIIVTDQVVRSPSEDDAKLPTP
jgi:outer membrane protein OmpA-like peptidoglycan-associated protein